MRPIHAFRRPGLCPALGAALLVGSGAFAWGGRSQAAPELAPARAVAFADDVSFNRDVRPLLADRCFPCHGPDGQTRKARLRLDTPDGAEGAYRSRSGITAIVPGALDDSELWYRVTSEDDFDRMPPPDSPKAPLDAEEREILRRWIEQGAAYETHWAFVAPERPELPTVADEAWCVQPLDRFVLRKLEDAGLRPSGTADKRMMIRRVTFDLTGLPPTRDEIRDFLADDRPDAYERLVDRLLARPQYGEHMAKHWLDLVRFADTNGKHHDHFRSMSHYRDWVIRAWNANVPYDEFITDQVAGDLRPDATTDQLIASGFNRLHLIIDAGTMLPEESFARNVIDRVAAVGTAFMGLTVECAVCHDHKYDPITQKDFYRLFAFFNNFDGAPETGGRSGADFRRGLQPPYISFPTVEQDARLEDLDGERASVESTIVALQAELESVDDDAARQDLEAALEEHRANLQRLAREREEVLGAVDAAMVMKERTEVRPTHVLVRGDYATPGELVERAAPGFLPPMPPAPTGAVRTRLDLAGWLVDPGHPLTARVAVNRFWQQLFGVGLVKTSEDFGTQGEWPSHPELLDDLAVEFVDSGWDVKALLRRMALSATYRQSSHAAPESFAADPENRRLARGSRFRMDAEMIRDQVLATSGLLDGTMYGPSVKPPQPAGIWAAVTLPDSYPRTFVADEGDATRRRSVYTFWKRGMPPPQMTILNAPTRESCVARRERTNTPLQALLLMNEQEYLVAARHLAQAALAENELAAEERLDLIYETITSRLPADEVRQVLLSAAKDLEAMYAVNPALAAELCAGVATPAGGEDGGDRARAELAAWTMVASAIYNLDITRTRE